MILSEYSRGAPSWELGGGPKNPVRPIADVSIGRPRRWKLLGPSTPVTRGDCGGGVGRSCGAAGEWIAPKPTRNTAMNANGDDVRYRCFKVNPDS